MITIIKCAVWLFIVVICLSQSYANDLELTTPNSRQTASESEVPSTLNPEMAITVAFLGNIPISKADIVWVLGLKGEIPPETFTPENLAQTLPPVFTMLLRKNFLTQNGFQVNTDGALTWLNKRAEKVDEELRLQPEFQKQLQEAVNTPELQLLAAETEFWQKNYPDQKVLPADVEDFYRRNQAIFLIPERRQATLLIVFKSETDLESRLRSIRAHLIQGGALESAKELYASNITPAEEMRLLSLPEVQEPLATLPPDAPEQISPEIVLNDCYIWGKVKVTPASYQPLDEILSQEIADQLTQKRLLLEIKKWERTNPPGVLRFSDK